MLSTPRTKSMIGSPIWRLTRTDVSMHYVHDVALVATITWLGGGGSIAGERWRCRTRRFRSTCSLNISAERRCGLSKARCGKSIEVWEGSYLCVHVSA